ncbi:DUF1512 domain-containing protein [Thermogladius sp. 4427co]|uniref:DUF1512 domain-containing protein n=1 Tax=Thermogladius sp. 4427co TaxID=3450718 RepID=UPI003F78FFF0
MMNSDTISLITQIIWLIIFVMLLTGLNQKIQMKIWAMDIRNKLSVIKRVIDEDRARVEKMISNFGNPSPSLLLNRFLDFFTIEPVSIEPTDIIRRLDHLIRTGESTFKKAVENAFPSIGKFERSLVETSIEILAGLNTIYKVVRHYLLTGERENNWILLMQLELLMPTIMRYVETYHMALDPFTTGKPIGDSAGPLVVYNLLEKSSIVSKNVIDDTTIVEAWLEGRRVFFVKAEGPGSNVGHPGSVINKLVEDLKGNVDLIITIDAALKLEGEETGSTAEGVGAAIGDPGPEKIAIERAAAKYNIPLRAIIIKMDYREALTTMKKEVFEATVRTSEYVLKLLREETKPNSTIIIAGIGNSIGVPY